MLLKIIEDRNIFQDSIYPGYISGNDIYVNMSFISQDSIYPGYIKDKNIYLNIYSIELYKNKHYVKGSPLHRQMTMYGSTFTRLFKKLDFFSKKRLGLNPKPCHFIFDFMSFHF